MKTTEHNNSDNLSFGKRSHKTCHNIDDKTISAVLDESLLDGYIARATCSTGESVHKPRIRATLSARAKNKSRLGGLSRGALKDELVYQLSSAAKMDWKTFEIIDKYYVRAKSVLYTINLYDLSAIDITANKSKGIFVINTSDISPSLCDELEQLRITDPKGFDELVTESIQSLMRGINERYYHVSGVAYRVTWRFDP